MNQLTLIGRLTKDIEIKESKNNDQKYGLITMAVDREYKNKSGEYETDFFLIPIFNKRDLKNLEKYTGKGTMLAVRGSIQSNRVDDKSYINILPNYFKFITYPKKDTDSAPDLELELDQPDFPDDYLISEGAYQNEVPNYVFNADEQPFH